MENADTTPGDGAGTPDPVNDPRRDIAVAEAQRMRVYASLPSSPWWFYPAFGGVLWLLLIGVAIDSKPLSIAFMITGAALLGVVTQANVRHAGFMPRISAMPSELRRAAIAAWVIYAVVWLATYALVWLVLDGVVVAAGIGALLWLALVIAGPAYDRLYARIADRLAAQADQIAAAAERR